MEPHGDGPTTIRVIEVRRDLADPLSVGREKLELLLSSMVADGDAQIRAMGGTLRGLVNLTQWVQTPVGVLLAEAVMDRPTSEMLSSVAARELLSVAPYIRLILGDGIQTRPGGRCRAIRDLTDAAVAAEELVEFRGLAAPAKGQIASAPWMMTGTVPAIAARDRACPDGFAADDGKLARRGLKSITVTAADAPSRFAELRTQVRAAVGFCFSGAAAALVTRTATGATIEPAKINIFGSLVEEEPPHTWRGEFAAASLAHFIGRLAKVTSIPAPVRWATDAAPLAHIYAAGGQAVYLRLLTEGRESPAVDAFLEGTAVGITKAALSHKLMIQAAGFAAKARLYIIVIEDVLGATRAAAVLEHIRVSAGSLRTDNPDVVLDALTAKERGIVITAADARVAEWRATVGNTCPHVKLARRLHTAATADDTAAALRELEKLLIPGDGQGWLLCRNCGSRALCGHARERATMEGRNAHAGAVRDAMLAWAVKTRSGDDLQSYFCRCCSERLAERDDEQMDNSRFGELDSGLRTRIWAIAMGAAKYVRFATPTDDRVFAASAADAVFTPFMLAAESATRRGRLRDYIGPDGEPVGARALLDVIIFVYAHILDLTQTSAASRSREVGFEGVKIGARASVYAEHILRHIATAHRGTISQIEDVTAEYIAARFTEAYRLVRGEASAAGPALAPEEELACFVTMTDQAYRVALTVARAAGALPTARAATPEDARLEFETIIGESLPGIIALARENARDPSLAPLYLRRTGIAVPPGGSLDYLVRDHRICFHAKLYELGSAPAWTAVGGANKKTAPSWRSVKPTTAKLTAPAKQSAPTPIPCVTFPNHSEREKRLFDAYRLFATYTKRIHNNTDYSNYKAELSIHRAADARLRYESRLAATFSVGDFGWRHSQQWRAVDLSLASLYDEEGRRHKWSSYVYGDTIIAGGEKNAGIKQARADGRLTQHMALTDMVCGICGVRASLVETLDAAKVTQAVVANGEIVAFYEYYASRCPAGLVHSWSSGRCERCGLDAAILDDATFSSAAAKEYHRKYAYVFATARSSTAAGFNQAQAAPATAPTAAPVTTWAPDFTAIAAAADLGGFPPTLLEAIGQTDGRDYGDVVEGRGVPLPPEINDPRIYAADAEVRLFLFDYNTLRCAASLREIPLGIVQVLDAAAAPRHELALLATLPDVGAGYREKFAAVLQTRSPSDAYTFAVQSLCEMAVAAANATGPDWLRKAGKEFAVAELRLIIKGQRLFAKPGPFNWAIFETEDPTSDVDEDDIDAPDDPDDPFSGESLDYDPDEIGPNLEPD